LIFNFFYIYWFSNIQLINLLFIIENVVKASPVFYSILNQQKQTAIDGLVPLSLAVASKQMEKKD